MSNLEMIERLCALLSEAIELVKEQAAILEMHGIQTDAETIERKRTHLLERVEKEGWG